MAAQLQVLTAPFPAPTKSTSAVINNTLTTATRIAFSDKLFISISGPGGKVPTWVHVPLASTNSTDPSNPAFTSASDTSLLPRTDLTATTVLGGTKRDEEIVAQTLATTIASAVLMKRPGEERLLVLGVGVEGLGEMGRDGFEEVVGLVLGVL